MMPANSDPGNARRTNYRFAHPEDVLKKRQRKYVAWFTRGPVRASEQQPILDLGCGRGFFLDLLAEAGLPAVGIDVSAEAIEECRRRGHDHCTQADALDFLETTDRQFAGIFCSHVVEHLAPPMLERLLAAIAARLVPVGRVVLITPNPVNLHVLSETFLLDTDHVRLYPLPLLEAMGRDAGFAVVEKGFDPDTAPRHPWWKWPLHALRALVLGRHYRQGEDTFLVVEKPPASG